MSQTRLTSPGSAAINAASGPLNSPAVVSPMGSVPAATKLAPLTLTADGVGRSLDRLAEREWLTTNGIGGFAAGTAAGLNTRKYHALLTAACRPPLDRWVMLSTVVVRISIHDRTLTLPTLEWPGSTVNPAGYGLLVSLSREAGIIGHLWQWEGVTIRQELLMVPGKNATAIRWSVDAGDRPVRMSLLPLVANRRYHSIRRRDRSGHPEVPVGDRRVAVRFGEEFGPTLHLACPEASRFEAAWDWWINATYREERARGYEAAEDLFTPGWFHAEPIPGGRRQLTLLASCDQPWEALGPTSATSFDALAEQRRHRLSRIVSAFEPADVFEAQLAESSDDYTAGLLGHGNNASATLAAATPRIASSSTPAHATDGEPHVRATILAGYPWFGDWGRDTMVALPGLLLAGRRYAEAREVLRTYANALHDGLVPNRFGEFGDGPEYNSADASLWLVRAVGEYYRQTGDRNFLIELGLAACETVLDSYRHGTQFGIRETPQGLIEAGNAQTNLTWMDARCGDTSFTPRAGCPVELAALWHHAQRTVAELRKAVGRPVEDLMARAARTAAAIREQFWDSLRGYLADTVSPDGSRRDMSLRPNQIFAVSLNPSPLTVPEQVAVVEVVEKALLTPVGLRTLAADQPGYRGQYLGNPWERDSAYHQGTVWPWLLGPYCEAVLRAHDFSRSAFARVDAVLTSLSGQVIAASLGHLPEIYDGNAPHAPRGAPAQAWSVAEILRIQSLVKARRRMF